MLDEERHEYSEEELKEYNSNEFKAETYAMSNFNFYDHPKEFMDAYDRRLNELKNK